MGHDEWDAVAPSSDQDMPAPAPPPRPADEDAARARVHARLFGAPSEGTEPPAGSPRSPRSEGGLPASIGRFRVEGVLGRGAMGQVLRAIDPELDRPVAIKILAPSVSSDDAAAEAERLRQEARALAKLSHPNVVTVHEVGTVEGRVYIAMEFVDGTTLAGHLAVGPRPIEEVVDLLVQAGDGLAAAHAAGIVHRDFKPANVLVGTNGRVRVADFGLAAHARSHTRPPAGGARGAQATSAFLAGTPAFMAPERLRGAPATAASDQFAFCVTAYWALFGAFPHEGDDAFSRALAIIEDRRRPPPDGRGVPRHLRRVVERGLRPDPRDRWPDMATLVAALRRDPRIRRRRAGVTSALVAASGIAAYLLASQATSPAAACRAPATATVELRRALDEAVPASSDRVTRRILDEHIEALAAGYHGQCVAKALGEPHQAGADCLALATLETRALIDAYATMPPRARPYVSTVAADLVQPESCRTARGGGIGPDETGALAETVRDLVRARVLSRSGDHAEAARLARGAAEAAETETVPVVEARARTVLGIALERLGRPGEAEASLRRAMVAAERGGDDLARARAAAALLYVLGRSQGRFEEALHLADQTRTLLDAVDAGDGVRADFENNLGAVLARAGRLEEADAAHRRALALRTKRFGPRHPATLASEGALAVVASSRGRHAEAIASLERTQARASQALGPDHPTTLSLSGNLATALARAGRTDDAARTLEALVARTESALGPDAPMLPTWIYNLATATARRGDPATARSYYRRGLALRRARGYDEATEIPWRLSLARTETALGHHDAARADLEAALRLALRARKPPATLAAIHERLAEAARRRGAPQAEVAYHERAAREARDAASLTDEASPP